MTDRSNSGNVRGIELYEREPLVEETREREQIEVREMRAEDATLVESIRNASLAADNSAYRRGDGANELASWATSGRLLFKEGTAIGVVAINATSANEPGEMQLALLPTYRQATLAKLLVQQGLKLASERHVSQLRLYLPSTTTWTISAVQSQGFTRLRILHRMLRPATLDLLPVQAPNNLRIRSLYAHEDDALLEALNRAWTGTWNFHPITFEALRNDLAGQRAGVRVASPMTNEAAIVGTIHAIFDPARTNPDGQPYAWISNLTVDPDWRDSGLGRALLTAGIEYLKQRGAGSIGLGVDGDSVAPMKFYRSTGFEVAGSGEVWAYQLQS